jgi:hypothetical protein
LRTKDRWVVQMKELFLSKQTLFTLNKKIHPNLKWHKLFLIFRENVYKLFIMIKSEYWFEGNFHSEIVSETLLPRFFIQSQHIFETLKPLNCFESNFTNRFKILQVFSEIISWKFAKQAQSRSRQQFMCCNLKIVLQ